MKKTTRQRGNIVIGLIVGLVLGLGVALGIAVYVTKVPIPFVTKTQRGGAEQDEAEARKNRDWDPNAPLAGKAGAPKPPAAAGPVAPPAGGDTAAVAPGTAPPPAPPVPVVVAPKPARPAPVPAEANSLPPSNDPLGDLARARAGGSSGSTTTASAAPSSNSAAAGADPFMYFVQAGAFRTTDDAEAQRAKLSLMGVEARVTEREQAGRTVYRVRAGPFNKKDEADRLKERLDSGGLESALVRVQR
ncbi:SPOR domain-containing protein [Variovorax paradoxus]|uniref:Cell division protein FtsN n=1 Tax=Variovorax paradoxus TaxID=34073 RepID=A0AAW8EBV7_VARPD|nr:SPOR domain-containing protein [Variovorax paradoxus]MDP9970004.1 cell division protein FtsN [Variovorax paradoxus]